MEQKRDGFTLIEMLVVMAIIITLVGLLFPALNGMQERGKITQDMNNLRQLGLGAQTYLNDNDGAFFLPTDNWMTKLHPKYLPSWKVFQSPFDRRTPSERDAAAPISYGFNANARGSSAPLLSEQITNPSLFILFAPAQDGSVTVRFTGTSASSVTVNNTTARGGTQNRPRRIDTCMADLHSENMDWNTFKNDAQSTNAPNAAQRWHATSATP